jgi:hypothetical protein
MTHRGAYNPTAWSCVVGRPDRSDQTRRIDLSNNLRCLNPRFFWKRKSRGRENRRVPQACVLGIPAYDKNRTSWRLTPTISPSRDQSPNSKVQIITKVQNPNTTRWSVSLNFHSEFLSSFHIGQARRSCDPCERSLWRIVREEKLLVPDPHNSPPQPSFF